MGAVFAIFGVVFTLVGLVAGWFAVTAALRARTARATFRRAWGVVIPPPHGGGLSGLSLGGFLTFRPTVSFTTHEGRTRIWTQPLSLGGNWNFVGPGSTVTVLYDPEDPEDARLERTGPGGNGCAPAIAAATFTFMGVGFLLIGGISSAVSRRLSQEPPIFPVDPPPGPAVQEANGPPMDAESAHPLPPAPAAEAWAVGKAGTVLHCKSSGCEAALSGTGEDLHAVHGSGPDDAWAVGGGGVILHFDGRIWTRTDGPAGAALRGVWARASDDAWAVGDEGRVLRFDGSKWTKQEVPLVASSPLLRVHAEARGDVWVTSDARGLFQYDGAAWTDRGHFRGNPITAVLGGASGEVWMGRGAEVWRSNDGTAWVVDSADVACDALAKRDGEVWSCGAQTVAQRVGGKWKQMALPILTPGHELLAALALGAETEVWVVGSSGVVLRQDGASWVRVPSRTRQSLTGVWAPGRPTPQTLR